MFGRLARISHQSVTRTEPEPPEWVYCAARAGNTAEAWPSHVAQGVFEHVAQMPAMAAPATGEGRIGEKCGLTPRATGTPLALWWSLILTAPPAECLAQTIIYAQDAMPSTLQPLLDTASSPTIIVLPPGQWEVIDTIWIRSDDVTLIGSGAAHTVLFRNSPPAGADRGVYTKPFLAAAGLARSRISSLSIVGWPATAYEDREVGIAFADCSDFRVDHCAMRLTGNSGVTTEGENNGVVDHCNFTEIYEEGIGNFGYGVSVYGDGVHRNEPFGSGRATFIEDNRFDGCRHAVASNRSARYVFRHNHVTGNMVAHAIDAHGAEFPPTPQPACDPCYTADPTNPGTEWVEVYGNLLERPRDLRPAIRIRGGLGLVYNNTIRDHNVGVTLSRGTPQPTGPVHIWGNDMGTIALEIELKGACCGAGPTSEISPPTDYSPFPYPHPLVRDLDVDAGPDMQVMAPAKNTPAAVYLDGTGTRADSGSIAQWQWFVDPTPLSQCARDIVTLDPGTHVLLLHARRDDGLSDVDTALVEVLPEGPLTSSTDWADLWFPPFTSSGAISFDVQTESNSTDAYVGITGRHPITDHTDQAMLVHLNSRGYFDARNATVYRADLEIPYRAGETYRIEVDFDLVSQIYTVRVNGAILATNYGFHHTETEIGQLSAWHSNGLGALEVRGFEFLGHQTKPCNAEMNPDPEPDPDPDPTNGDADPPPSHQGDTTGCNCRTIAKKTPMPWMSLALTISFVLRSVRRRRFRP